MAEIKLRFMFKLRFSVRMSIEESYWNKIIMVVESNGYLSLIQYLTDSIEVFVESDTNVGNESIEEVVMDMISSNIMTVFQQNPTMHTSLRFRLLKEVDRVVEDLGEALSGVWLKPVTNNQVAFLEDYIGLVKNLFDSAVATHD